MRLSIPRFGLQPKIVAWSFVPAAIILLGVGLFTFFFLQVAVETLMVESNRETTELMAEQIRGEIAALADDLKNVARTPGLVGDDLSTQSAVLAMRQAATSLESFDGGVVVLNRQGKIIAAEPERQAPQEDWSHRPYFLQILDSPETILSDIHSDSAQGTLAVTLAVPIVDADRRLVGAVAGMFRVDPRGESTLNHRFMRFRKWPSGYSLVGHAQPISTYMVDHNGQIVFHTEAGQVGRNISSANAVQAVLRGAPGPVSSAEFRGKQVITYYSPIRGTGWGLLIEQSHSKALGFFQSYFQLQTVFFALALVVPAGLVAFGVRRITEPIRQVTAATRQIAAGDLQQVIHVRTGDELEELANQFNRMSTQLRESYSALKEREERLALVIRATNDGIWDWDLKTNQVYYSPRWKAMLGYGDDEIGNTLDDWRRLVHPADVQRALDLIGDYSQGKTSSYELGHRLQHKDGSYRWVLARGISLSGTDGKPYRLVGSHTDITDRKRIEEKLKARLGFEHLITGISTEFVNLAPDEIDKGIQRALQSIGEFAQVDRSYVFLISSDGTTMDNTHEWCAPGIESFIHKLKNVPIDTFPWLVEQLKQLRVIHVPSLDALPLQAVGEKREFEQQKIQSLINVPMVYRGTLVGFLGMDSVLTAKTWSEDTIALLRIVGETFANALEHKREQALQAGQRHFLELLATGGDFSAMLHTLVRIVEEQWRGMLGLILLLDEDSQHLHIGASVSLPQDYVGSIEGLEIGPMVGSCGTACYRRERVIVEDILTDPRWDGLRHLAVQYGLRACWSEPVIAGDGKVIGTFAMYYRQPRAPTQDELRTISTAAHLVGIAIEHQQAQQALRRSEARFRSMFEQAPVGMVITDGQVRRVNRAAQEIVGYSEDELLHMKPDEYSHPDDVALDERLHAESEAGQRDRYQIEKRYFPRDGRTVWTRYTHTILRDDQRKSLLHFAILEDITEQRKAEAELRQAYDLLERRVQERTRELAMLNSIAAVVSQSLDLKEIMRDALEQTMQVCGMDAGAAYELDDASQSLSLIAAKGLSEEFTQRMGGRVPLQAALPGQVLNVDRPLEWQVAHDYPEGAAKNFLLGEGLSSLFTVPLVAKGKIVGAFGLSSKTSRELTVDESALLLGIGRQVGIAVENARLYKQAQRVATTAERSRLARELHDSVTQSLYSVMLYAEAAARSLTDKETAEAGDFLKELRDTAQDALREMRLLIFELRPPTLEKDGLIGALRTRLNAVEGRGGMKTDLRVNDDQLAAQLPFTLQEALYHIAQEALNNVIRHAHAQSVRIGLQFSRGEIQLEVSDDGIGFDPENAGESSGLGLQGMRERVQRIRGSVQITSAPGKGTRVMVLAPYATGS